MIAGDGRTGGDARHDGLGAAAVAREPVKFHISEADPPVGLRNGARDIHRRTAVGHAEADAVVRVAVHAADRLKGVVPGKLPHLLRRMPPVAADRKYDRHIRRLHAAGKECPQQLRQDLIRRQRPRDVARDDGDLLAPVYDLAQRRTADGVRDGLRHQLPRRFLRQRKLVLLQDAEDVFVRDAERLAPAAVSEFNFHVKSL